MANWLWTTWPRETVSINQGSKLGRKGGGEVSHGAFVCVRMGSVY